MVERLTRRTESGIAYTKIPANPSNMIDVGECYTGRIIDRIAAYEDTGLTPEQIEAQQQEIERLDDDNGKLRMSVDLTAGRIIQMEDVLRQTKTAINDLMACNEISKIADIRGEEAIKAIDALLGGEGDG